MRLALPVDMDFSTIWPLNQDNIKNELGSAPNPSTKPHTAKGSTTPKESAVESRPPHFSAENFRVPMLPSPQTPEPCKGHQPPDQCTHPVALQSVMVGASQGLHLTIRSRRISVKDEEKWDL